MPTRAGKRHQVSAQDCCRAKGSSWSLYKASQKLNRSIFGAAKRRRFRVAPGAKRYAAGSPRAVEHHAGFRDRYKVGVADLHTIGKPATRDVRTLAGLRLLLQHDGGEAAAVIRLAFEAGAAIGEE